MTMAKEEGEPVFECKRCGHCCHGVATVSLSQDEQEGIARFLGITMDELFERYLVRKGSRVEMQVRDGHCIFYGEDGLCQIHPVKPFHCRRWPLHPSILNDENAWLAIKADCPGFRKDASYREVVRLVRSKIDQLDTIEKTKKLVNITCPFDLLYERYLERVLEEGLNLEIGLNGTILDTYSCQDFQRVQDALAQKGIRVSIHGPFTDLPLGSCHKATRMATKDVLIKAMDVATIFNSATMVIHSGFDPKHHGDDHEDWGKRAIQTLDELLEHARKATPPIMLLLENTFEPGPDLHRQIFSRFPLDAIGFCFDLAHQRVFSSTTMDVWLSAVGERLMELHLHDNHGKEDEHLAVGAGVLDFDALFSWIKRHKKTPILTIEAHEEAEVMPAIVAVGKLITRYGIMTRDPNIGTHHSGPESVNTLNPLRPP